MLPTRPSCKFIPLWLLIKVNSADAASLCHLVKRREVNLDEPIHWIDDGRKRKMLVLLLLRFPRFQVESVSEELRPRSWERYVRLQRHRHRQKWSIVDGAGTAAGDGKMHLRFKFHTKDSVSDFAWKNIRKCTICIQFWGYDKWLMTSHTSCGHFSEKKKICGNTLHDGSRAAFLLLN